MELFCKVKTIDRLPDQEGRYFIFSEMEGLHTAVFIGDKFLPDQPRFLLESEIYYWLEEIPEVSVDDIAQMIYHHVVIPNDGGLDVDEAAKIIHKLIYREE